MNKIKNLIKADLQRKTNCYYVLKPINQVLIALQFYASGGLLQVVGDTTGVHKSIISLAVHSERCIGNDHSAYSREIALWDANCRLVRHYKWFLHHVLTVNQRLRSFPSIALRIPTAHNFTPISARALENGGFFFTTGPRGRGKSSFSRKRLR